MTQKVAIVCDGAGCFALGGFLELLLRETRVVCQCRAIFLYSTQASRRKTISSAGSLAEYLKQLLLGWRQHVPLEIGEGFLDHSNINRLAPEDLNECVRSFINLHARC